MPIRRHNLTGLGAALPHPDIEALVGLRPFVEGPWGAVARAQDKLSCLSRRTVLSWGLRGDAEWRVPNTNPYNAAQLYPNRTTWYTVARTRFAVTPGCFLSASIAHVPSGETSRPATAGEVAAGSLAYRADGAAGWVRITVTWYDRASGSEQTIVERFLEGSTLTYGAEDTESPGGLWRTLQQPDEILLLPPDISDDSDELARFSRHVTADVLVEHRGSPRIVDAHIRETPFAIAFDSASGDDTYRTSHLYAPGSPDAPGVPPTHALATVAARALVVARAQARRLNPVLLHWTAYTETGATPTATIMARTTSNDGTTYESVLNASHTGAGPAAYDATLPGWSVSCGGYARRWTDCNHLVLRDRIAVVPVIVRAYGRGITAGTSTVRVQTALHSYVDLVLPVAGSASWSCAYGYLEVGISPEQPQIAQVFLNHLGASGSLSVEAVTVEIVDAPVAA